MINRIPAGWVAVARDTYEYNMRAWVRRRREQQWLRDSLRPHPVDPRGQVLVPSQIHEVFKKRRHFTPATARELTAAGYPKLPRDRVFPAISDSGTAALLRSDASARHPSTAVQERVAA
jgi:hypothetical protein